MLNILVVEPLKAPWSMAVCVHQPGIGPEWLFYATVAIILSMKK